MLKETEDLIYNSLQKNASNTQIASFLGGLYVLIMYLCIYK